MRHSTRPLIPWFLLCALAGCGGASGIDAGIPKDLPAVGPSIDDGVTPTFDMKGTPIKPAPAKK